MKKLVCVRFPGWVENADKAVDCLGGIDKISETVIPPENRRPRMELKFRPSDVYCKPTFGERTDLNGLLVKVKRKKNKTSENSEKIEQPWKVEVIGYVETVYKFEAMCDFQYLPVTSASDQNKPTSFHNEVSLGCWKKSEDVLKPVTQVADPLFVPPGMFSRFDRPALYFFRDKTSTNLADKLKEVEVNEPLRQRALGSQLLHFGAREVPNGPTPGTLDHFETVAPTIKGQLEMLKSVFEGRPVWSKIAIADETKLSAVALKFLLPMVSYYFLSGPWRYCWVKYGYDPRKDPEARKYQVVDFRARKEILRKVSLPHAFSSNFSLGALKRIAPNPSAGEDSGKLFHDISARMRDSNSQALVLGDAVSMTRITATGAALRQKQVMFQVCDIDIPAFHVALAEPAESVCGDGDGFFKPGSIFKLRDEINSHIEHLINKHVPGASDESMDTFEDGSDEYESPDYEDDD
jgi:general transcription factor 3C polypeptide 5 (transcription factor C subunit 1)